MSERVEAVWQRWEGHGMERLRLATGPEGVHAEGDVLTPEDVRAHYRVRCDPGWRTRHVEVTVLDPRPRVLRLDADGRGSWAGHPELEGCVDVDIYPSPFTNSLPVRRLGLAPGESAELTAAWVRVPELTVEPVRQRYTRVGEDRWRFEAVETGFAAELAVDGHGLVVDYPGLARRLRPHGGE